MLPTDICRTCALQNSNLLPLSTCLARDATKSLYAVLQELTQIDPQRESADDNLPQHLCTDCWTRLEDAYAFVEQAREVNGELTARLRECLDEMPIDIPQEQSIKTEVDLDDGGNKSEVDVDATGMETLELKWRPESASDEDFADAAESDEDKGDQKPYHLRRSYRKVKLPVESENEDVKPTEPSPIKRRRGRPPGSAKSQSKTTDGRHACEVCGKTFSWYRDMQRHARMHFEQASFVCDTCGKGFLRKDKYTFHLRCHKKREAKWKALQLGNEWRFAERLYSSGSLKRVECKLCGLKCTHIEELRSHLKSHVDLETLVSLRKDSDVVREHFPGLPCDLDIIKQQISADIAEGQTEKFACVVNFHGYELGLSDSDDESASLDSIYNCSVCNLPFNRKHRLVKHTLEEHSQTSTALPWQRCSFCKIGFLCSTLYNQHLSSHCHSKIKRYRCRKCPGKFMWPENLQRHACSHRREGTMPRHISCSLCDSPLASLARLRIHLTTHQLDLNGISPEYNSSFFRSFYPNGLDCSAADLAARIAEDFEVQDFDRYYNACTESGQELDLFDSESEESDETSKLSHTCLLCGETSSTLTILMQHQKKVHSSGSIALPCTCEKCGSGFVSKALLQQHRRRSCGQKHSRFYCQACNLRFVWQANYEQHLRTHHDTVKKYDEETMAAKQVYCATKLQCDECDKVFIWHKDLTRHKRLHQPQSAAQFDCPHCHRKFHRKDGLKSHLKVHPGAPENLKEEPATAHVAPGQGMALSRLSRPHGCKLIQCMICLSRHSKISDLRTHLKSHQYGLSLSAERDTASASRSFYPELEIVLEREKLAGKIMADVERDLELDRFVSITNEAGLELNLDSSETDSESEQEQDISEKCYACNLCSTVVRRKYQLFAHQLEQHEMEETCLVCSHCQVRFVNESLLDHHSRTLCYNPQKVFQCRKCPLRFRWRENLKLHTSLCHQQGEIPIPDESSQAVGADLQCGECHRSFKMQKDLTRHTLMHAQESNIFRCRWCARRFYRWANLLQHIARHGISVDQLPYAEAILDSYGNPGGHKKVECRVCSLSFPTIAALRLHLETMPAGSHHELSSLQNYSITNQMGFEMELDDSETDEEDGRTHSKPPGVPDFYTCGMCQLRCSRKFELHQHQQAMHRMEKIPDGCDRCLFKSVCPEIIVHHRKTQCENREKQFTCTRCGYKFMWESNLLQHMQLQHEKQEDQELDESKEASGDEPKAEVGQVFQCGLCPRKYNRKDRLTAHSKKFHGPDGKGSNPVKVSNRATSPKEPKRFLCAFCGKAVSSSSNLIIHMRRHTGEKPFKCEYCTMAFPRSSDLQCHRRTHTGERPHVCTVCQKGFARSYKLQQHMRIHSGERPYKCTYCEKSFTQSNDLTLHIRRHTGERPYQCGVCGERFIQGTALKNHRMQQNHYEEGQESGETPRRTVLEQFTI
ncbi:zinc finger protein 91 [Drosophila gunungcola]|uniref:zinc finger protein 91 n=1 Tax=Drosophila gunungcola TaxID=103775 RepID=UPI0022E75357|nr:zinc finger protein 91 [Drosophila gunungcola]